MCHCNSHLPSYFGALAIGLSAFWLLNEFDSPRPTDRDAMIGTWTEEAGDPGNSIRFYFVPINLPSSPIVEGYEGRATVNGLLGETQAQAIWNYGYWEPLVLNVNIGAKSWYAVIQKQDDDHILIRFSTDPAEVIRPGAIDHPDTRKLTRIGREN